MEGWCVTCPATTGRPEERQQRFPLVPLVELSFSLSFPFHGPSPIFPCDFQQKLLATANLLQAYDSAEELFLPTCLVHIPFHLEPQVTEPLQSWQQVD
jgi:hypothetical protein